MVVRRTATAQAPRLSTPVPIEGDKGSSQKPEGSGKAKARVVFLRGGEEKPMGHPSRAPTATLQSGRSEQTHDSKAAPSGPANREYEGRYLALVLDAKTQ